MVNKYKNEQYTDMIRRLYKDKIFNNVNNVIPRVITFQVTEDCPMACTYCYQGNKSNKTMTKEISALRFKVIFYRR